MSLTKEQKKELQRLGEYFKTIEKLAAEKNIDLDVYMSEYKDDGYAIYATEQVALNEKTEERKKVFEKATKEKPERSPASKSR